MGFLQPQTLAALGATQHGYSKRFTIAAATGGSPNPSGSDGIAIQGGTPFVGESLFIDYPTTWNDGEEDVDDGVCRLTLMLKSNTSVQLWNDPVRLDLISVPGRQTVEGISAPGGDPAIPGSAPNIDGLEWIVFLAGGSTFSHDFFNSSNLEAVVNVFWRGWNLDSRVDTREKFWQIVMDNQLAPSAF